MKSNLLAMQESVFQEDALLPLSPTHAIWQGKKLLDFSSQDFLGLSNHPDLKKHTIKYLLHYGNGICHSDIPGSFIECQKTLEIKIAELINMPYLYLFSNRYLALWHLLSSLSSDVLLLLADDLDPGLSKILYSFPLKILTYNQNSLASLEAILKREGQSICSVKMIFCESISSSNGTLTDLNYITSLSQAYNALLVVDDSLAFGVKGDKGLGLAAKREDIDLILCSLSNSASADVAFLGCSSWIKNLIKKNVFYRESSVTYASLGAIEMALDLIPSLEGERYQLEQRCHWVKKQLQGYEINCSTHVICLHFSQKEELYYFWESLLQRGILTQWIICHQKSSYVLRLFINIHHTPDDLRMLVEEIKELKSG